MRFIRHFLLVLMLMCGFTASAANDYVLVDSIQGGVILQCFGWKFTQITEKLDSIAAAGFTTVQTSPAQVNAAFCEGDNTWKYLYQPLGFCLYGDTVYENYVAVNDGFKEALEENGIAGIDDGDPYDYSDDYILGTPDELKALCDSAHSRNMFVIVDVVANNLSDYDDYIQADLKDDSLWHDGNYNYNADYEGRGNIIKGEIDGLPDLATENEYVQHVVLAYLKELDSLGVDGIRWDSAKNIGLPTENKEDFQDDFWPTVTTQSGLGLYNYGEIISKPGSLTEHNHFMQDYCKYMSVTDDDYGYEVLDSFANNAVPTSYANWVSTDYVDAENVVYMTESYDTYFDEDDSSSEIDQNIVDRVWAVVASRSEATALYFSRPKNDSFGKTGSTHFTSPEVAAVNHLHNICNGEPDYFSYNDSAVSVTRSSGAVIVLGSGSNKKVTVNNGGGYTPAGTYIDRISGDTFTVTNTTITGTVGSTGIAVIYSDEALLPRIILDPDDGYIYYDSTTITATLNTAAISGTVKVGDGEEQTITETTTLTIGKGTSVGDSVTIYWTATDGTQTNSGSSTYVRSKTKNIVFYVKNDKDHTVSLYTWDDDGNEYTGSFRGRQLSQIVTKHGTEFVWYEVTNIQAETINAILCCESDQTSNIEKIDCDAYFSVTHNSSDVDYEVLYMPGILPESENPLFVYINNDNEYEKVGVKVFDDDSVFSKNGEEYEELTNIVSTYNGYDVYKWIYDGIPAATPNHIIVKDLSEGSTEQTDTLDFINGAWYSNSTTWYGANGKVSEVYDVIYDEKTANADYRTSTAADYVNVSLVREFSDSYWNTICLPFDVPCDTIKKTFGDNAQVYEFTSVADSTLYFSQVDTILAGVPYLIKSGSATVTNPYFYVVDMDTTAAKSVYIQNEEDGEAYYFTGTYSPCDLDTLRDMFFNTSGKLVYPYSYDYTIKGLRAYVTTMKGGTTSTTSLAVSFEPMVTTGISNVDTDDNDAAADIYSISGQKVNGDISTLPRGIYITKGRKFIIK